ncbi:MAG TPA: 16S rRNA (guanine(966)-N(2))-methyltransferase RsmD [Xanthomonadaceae bacterium]|nr:16S rRNA (guanine(966)-N(2))-methyltransferase RsmD [Xanthomonadaceae bacterium]
MSTTGPRGSVRIVGGRLRGSRLPVAAQPGMRPTPDRVRETLFNWLQPVIDGARCLDLFAGSGALGLEAVSRGAVQVLMVERDPALARALREQAERLLAAEAEILCTDALALLRGPATPAFDVVFVDPPFGQALWAPVLDALPAWLRPGALVYVESPVDAALEPPRGYALHREGRTRETRYALYRYGP